MNLKGEVIIHNPLDLELIPVPIEHPYEVCVRVPLAWHSYYAWVRREDIANLIWSTEEASNVKEETRS